jgi:hypothetical protein
MTLPTAESLGELWREEPLASNMPLAERLECLETE